MSLLFHRGNVGNDGGGTEKIEEIREGDLVLAYDEETGEQAYKPVVRLFRNESKDWVGVTVDGKETISTPGHKYYVPENEAERNFGEVLEHAGYAGLSEKWVSAQRLKFGDKVLLSDGTYGIIQTVKVETLSVPETTYNLEVEDFHTYFVGEHSVCVHNADCSNLTRAQKRNIDNINNNINDHLTDADISAALGDIQGRPIINSITGKTWQHLNEVKDAYRGISKSVKALQASLQNPNLTISAKTIISETVNKGLKYINLLDELFLPFGGL